MLKRILLLLLILLVSGSVLNAQDQNKLNTYIERAFKFKGDGLFETALITWDLYLKEVQKTEGEECLHYFMGIVYKSGVLIDAERYSEAEELLLSVKIPSEGNLELHLTFFKNLGKCAYHLNKYEDSIAMYIEAFNTLSENIKYYSEINDETYHWCWRDELCHIALELSNVYVALNLYEDADDAFIITLNSLDEEWNNCVLLNRHVLYSVFFHQYANLNSILALKSMQGSDYETTTQYYKELLHIVSLFPDAKYLDYDLSKYVVGETAKRNLDEAVKFANQFIEVSTATSLYYYENGYGTFDQFCDNVSLCNTVMARVFEENKHFNEAEHFFNKAIDIYTDNDVRNEKWCDTYLDLANFQQIHMLDYHQSLKSHFKHFYSLIKTLGKDDDKVFNAFDLMCTEYDISLLMLDQLGVDDMFTVIDTSYADFNITYDAAYNIILEWRNILLDITKNYGKVYLNNLIEYHNNLNKEYLFNNTGVIDETTILEGSLPENYSYEVLLNIHFDNLKEYSKSIERFRSIISISSPEYYEFIHGISRTLENKNYIEWCISLLSEEIVRSIDEDNMELSERLKVDLIETSLRYGVQNIAWDIIIHDIAYHETFFGPYDEQIPRYMDVETYVEKLFSFAWAYQSINDYDTMIKYTNILDEVLKNNVVPRHNVQESRVCRNLSQAYYYKKEYDKALEYQLESISKYGKEENHTKIGWPVMAYHELAGIYLALDRPLDAIDILNMCVEHCKLPIEGVDRNIPFIYGTLVSAYKELGQFDKMAKYANYMYQSKKSYFNNKTFGIRKNNVAEVYYADSFPIFLEYNCSLALDNPLMVDLCYDIVLTQKGFLINYDKIIFNNVNSSDDFELKKRYTEYKKTETSQSDSLWYYESKFLASYSEHEEFKDQGYSVKWNDIQTVLDVDDLAVEFTICYKEDTNTYAALLLKKDWDSPKIIELCEESELKRIMASGARLYNENAAAYSCIWEKLEPYFKKGDNIYFAPHGLIHQLNIEVLCGADGKPMNKKCNLYRLSSTGNLVDKREDLKYTSATLYGGLNYDTDTTSMVAINRNYVTSPSYQRVSIFNESVQTRAGWSYLPGTAEEVRNVGDILGRNKIETTTYTDETGTEESFKALSGNSTPIIHIATHGFYLEDKNARRVEMFQAFEENNTQTISPLKRSGLMFSGGQHAWLGRDIPEGIDDGVLTAEEIAGMNLTGTDLLVLSACQTGLGEITNEGVEGLQRGFKIAGVNTIIMSLWEVSDAATEVLMTKFYSLLIKGKTKREAFDAAVEAVKKEYPSPEYWAAFIMLD